MSVDTTRARILHPKRSFGKYPRMADSPAYDAHVALLPIFKHNAHLLTHRSEEDNDPLTDVDSAISVPLPSRAGQFRAKPSQARMKHLAISLLSDSDGVDSPTYDGDVESTAGGRIDTQTHRAPLHTHHSTSSTSTLSNPHTVDRSSAPENVTPGPSAQNTELFPVAATGDLDVSSILEAPFNPAVLTAEDIQSFARKAIEGESARNYRINPPPTDRPVRIYADGVYDLFHFGHALQLRQAKLSFPFVYLMVGVNSDEQVHHHKGRTVMDHTERIEAVQHCRWVDEVIPEAPWVIEEDFIHKYQIDYVAHDEAPYLSSGHDDVYSLCKRLGKFLPTRRTPGVSTSELLERIVTKYRKRDFDEKLSRMGHAELRAEGSDYDDLSPRSRVGSPPPTGKPIDVSIPPKPSFSSPHVSQSSSRVISPLASPGGSQTYS